MHIGYFAKESIGRRFSHARNGDQQSFLLFQLRTRINMSINQSFQFLYLRFEKEQARFNRRQDRSAMLTCLKTCLFLREKVFGTVHFSRQRLQLSGCLWKRLPKLGRLILAVDRYQHGIDLVIFRPSEFRLAVILDADRINDANRIASVVQEECKLLSISPGCLHAKVRRKFDSASEPLDQLLETVRSIRKILVLACALGRQDSDIELVFADIDTNGTIAHENILCAYLGCCASANLTENAGSKYGLRYRPASTQQLKRR